MCRPTVPALLPVLLIAVSTAARAEPLSVDQPPASAWYALLIVVFAAVVVVGLLGSRGDQSGDKADTRQPPRPPANKKESLR